MVWEVTLGWCFAVTETVTNISCRSLGDCAGELHRCQHGVKADHMSLSSVAANHFTGLKSTSCCFDKLPECWPNW
eukprot:6487083-Amphidinium_carterae.1